MRREVRDEAERGKHVSRRDAQDDKMFFKRRFEYVRICDDMQNEYVTACKTNMSRHSGTEILISLCVTLTANEVPGAQPVTTRGERPH